MDEPNSTDFASGSGHACRAQERAALSAVRDGIRSGVELLPAGSMLRDALAEMLEMVELGIERRGDDPSRPGGPLARPVLPRSRARRWRGHELRRRRR